MNIFEKIARGDTSLRGDTPSAQRQIERLKQINSQLQTKSISNNEFKVITGTGLDQAEDTTNKRPSLEELLVKGYAGNTMTHAIIKKVSEVASQIPWLVQTSNNGVDWIDEDGEVQAIVNRPNAEMTANEFRINAMVYLMSTGNAYFRKKGEAGSSILSFSDDKSKMQFELLPSNLIEIHTDSTNNIKYYEFLENGGSARVPLTPEQVTHVKFLDPTMFGHTSHLGMSPLVACWNIVKASNNLALADASMLENKGVLGIISNKNDTVAMTENERDDMQEATDDLIGGADKFAKTLVSGTPIDYTSIGMSSSDLQMIEGGVFKDRQIASAFGVSSLMFNDTVASTLDNMKVASKKLYTDSAIPNNDVLLRAFELGLIPTYEKRTGLKYRIVQDTSGIEVMQSDKVSEADKNAKNVDSIIKLVSSNLPKEMIVMMLVKMFELDEKEIEGYFKRAETEVVPEEEVEVEEEVETVNK